MGYHLLPDDARCAAMWKQYIISREPIQAGCHCFKQCRLPGGMPKPPDADMAYRGAWEARPFQCAVTQSEIHTYTLVAVNGRNRNIFPTSLR